MDLFSIHKDKRTPKIDFDLEKGELSLSGNSMPENVSEFYAPLLKLIEDNMDVLQQQESVFKINIRLNYFNTSSLKFLTSLFKLIISIKGQKNVEIDWFYENDDVDMLETANDVAAILAVNVNFIPQ
jgi:hypothetical protein